MDIKLKPRKVIQFLLMLTIGFTLAHILGQLVNSHLESTLGLFLFNIDQGQSIFKFYSAAMLLLCSGLFLIVAMAKKRDSSHSFPYWLALIFLFLAITKDTAIHESLAAPIRLALNMSKIKFYACTYGIVAVIFPMVYVKFLLSLPKRTMLLLATGVLTFIVGAFGLDLIIAYLGKSIGHHTVTYIGLATLEEVLEMGGTLVIVYALMSYMSLELKRIEVRFTE